MHAPTNCSHKSVREGYWTAVYDALAKRKRTRRYPLIILGDLNASLGSTTSIGIGSLDAATDTENGKAARKLVRMHHLTAPSTFANLHAGQSYTFTDPKGHHSRKDYVLVDRTWLPAISASFVDTSLHIAVTREDHVPVAAVFNFVKHLNYRAPANPLPRYDPSGLQEPEVREEPGRLLDSVPNVPWAVDPDSHANALQWHFRTCLAQAAPPLPAKPRDSCISDASWAHIQQAKVFKSERNTSRRCENQMVRKFWLGLFRIVTLGHDRC